MGPKSELNKQAPLPLQGLRVLDCSRVLAGPFCTMQLADMGAEVIKIEHPTRGDDTRHWGPPFYSEMSAYFASVNRGKKSVALDFQSPEGKKIFCELIKKSDVFIENFKAGDLEKKGLGNSFISSINPGIVHCSITGYGYHHKRSSEPGYDFAIQAEAGLMSINGTEKNPQKVGVAIVDITAGMFALSSILAAIHHKKETGEGQWIDVSLFDAQLGWLANVGQNFLCTKDIPKRIGNAHHNIVPYQSFESKGQPFVLAVGNDNQFQRCCKAINRQDLWMDTRFQTNQNRVKYRKELICKLQATFYEQDATYWIEELKKANIPCSLIQNLDQVFTSEIVADRNMLHTFHLEGNEAIEVVGPVAKFSKTPIRLEHPPPKLGEHTYSCLCELLDLSEEEITKLFEQEILA